MNNIFRSLSHKVSQLVGSAPAFLVVLVGVIGWFATGPMFGFSDEWQLFINTVTTIITFLMVFLIQNTQNRDAKALHLKLDELIKSVHGARNSLVNSEELSDEELEELHQEFRELQEKYLHKYSRRGKLKLVLEPHSIQESIQSA